MAEFALNNKINQAHERIDALEKKVNGHDINPRDEVDPIAELAAIREECRRLAGEIQALKMRMGKQRPS